MQSGNSTAILGTSTAHDIRFQANSNDAIRIANGGDISFYEDTGTTAKLFWDASAESLGIGTAAPDKAIHVKTAVNNTAVVRIESTATDSYPTLSLKNDAREYQLTAHGPLGDVFTIYDGTAGSHRFVIDSTGAVTMPAQPAFLVRPASGQSNLPINATTTIAFGTEIFDQNADFASNTFTAPVAGRYLLTTGLYSRALDHDTSYYQLELATSNRVYYDIISMSGFDADVSYYEFKICVLADMDAGDTAFVRMGIPNNGAAQVQIDTVSNFSGHLVA